MHAVNVTQVFFSMFIIIVRVNSSCASMARLSNNCSPVPFKRCNQVTPNNNILHNRRHVPQLSLNQLAMQS